MRKQQNLTALANELEGELHFDSMSLAMYATDASVYRELPVAVAFPKTKKDIQSLIQFANRNKTSLIPRTAGTSLAGQCVGNGIVVDVSKHFTKILELHVQESWVRVEAGVIRDELNSFLESSSLLFGPETSTANRAMIGGMVGNNSTGSNSIVYGNTRDHVIELEAFLSDGSLVRFEPLKREAFEQKLGLENLEGKLYRHIYELLSNAQNRDEIKNGFPKPEIHRRNTGYAIDELMDCELFNPSTKEFNFCKLLCGSEGTLAFITEIKLNLIPLPPKESVLLCPHFSSLHNALKAVQEIMKYPVYSCELMDKLIMDCTKENPEYKKYRFFVDGDPEALLIIELRANTRTELEEQSKLISKQLEENCAAFSIPKIYPPDTKKVWNLRKAGLGLLANIPGDKKAVAVIEDTAVHIDDLANYIDEFTTMMLKHGQEAVYYAHAGAGEIHLRPILNLKKREDVELFKAIAWDTAYLVKKYKGSLSGEHGDGRVRASFIPFMLGEKNYAFLKDLKTTWDPNSVFNAGKIIDAPAIDKDLRYEIDRKEPELKSLLNFKAEGGILRLAEKCNGSGDCRKTHLSGGTMCPSYMASKNEKDTTRARANVLREFLTQNTDERNAWSSEEIKQALDLCLSCKGCKSECPSNVDVAIMKAEFTYQYNQINGIPFRSKLFGHVASLNKIGIKFPGISNWVNSWPITKKLMGLAPEREAPKLAKESLQAWFTNRKVEQRPKKALKSIYLFSDEFTNYYDVEIGKKAVLLLEHLAYEVKLAPIEDSGRAFISKGMLKEAKVLANKNYQILKSLITTETPLVGIEPSAILSFRDEYQRLVDDGAYSSSEVYKNSLSIEEFLVQEWEAGKLNTALFTEEHRQVILHGHCHQKALSEVSYTQKLLNLPKNYHVETLNTGCCGMAGSFGYEKEHYQTSMSVGELVLFPSLRKLDQEAIICAPGTSCRHQISDGTQRKALHPVEILYQALL
ncbi:MAG: FAD-linked oxidase C-terminal domain-containing protein [Chitinophagales bacterium]